MGTNRFSGLYRFSGLFGGDGPSLLNRYITVFFYESNCGNGGQGDRWLLFGKKSKRLLANQILRLRIARARQALAARALLRANILARCYRLLIAICRARHLRRIAKTLLRLNQARRIASIFFFAQAQGLQPHSASTVAAAPTSASVSTSDSASD